MATCQTVCPGFPGIHNYGVLFCSIGNILKKWTNNHHNHTFLNSRTQAVVLRVSEVRGDTGRIGELASCDYIYMMYFVNGTTFQIYVVTTFWRYDHI